MAKLTANYKLTKPESTDFYSVGDFNGNADSIDAALFKKAERPATCKAGNLAALTADGHLADSGKTTKSFLPGDTIPADIGAESAGAAAAVQASLGNHINDTNKHFTAAEKSRLAIAMTSQDIVVSASQPAAAVGRIWIKI